MVKLSEEQFAMKYDKYSQLLFNISYGYTKNTNDSEDIIHNVFMKYLDYPKAFKSLEDEKCWLIRVTINESINFVNCYYKKKVILDNDIVDDSEDNRNESYQELLYYIDKAPTKYKQILILYYFDDLNVNELSKYLKISSSAVKMRLMRARDYLKKQMEDNND